MNTYSNLGLFIVGVLLLWSAHRQRDAYAKVIERNIGLISIIIGISSATAHATQLLIGSLMDYVAQFLLMAYVVSLNGARLWRWSSKLQRGFVFLVVVLAWIICSFEKHIGLFLFVFFLGAALFTEFLNQKRIRELKEAVDRSALVNVLIFLGIGLICFGLDAEKIGCDANNHIFQLHGVWHLWVAGSIFYTAKYYGQFKNQLIL